MTEQKKQILESADYIKSQIPTKGKIDSAIVTYWSPDFLKDFKAIKKICYDTIPPKFKGVGILDSGEIWIGSFKGSKKNIIVLNGRYHFYNGYPMRETVHLIYVLKQLGIKNVILIDEVGHLNPRFEIGGVALIYDQINLMGDNPLIGENDSSIGLRFPDMSNAYDSKLYKKSEKLFIENSFKFYPSVYLGITGPETETEAECRFYRETGSDVVGYALAPENIAAVHCRMNVLAFGMISRELVADRLKEISKDEQAKNRMKAEREMGSVISKIVDKL